MAATFDIILSWKAWGSMRYTQIIRYLLKFVVAAAWLVVLPIGYSSTIQNPTGLIKFFSTWASNWQSQPFFNFAIAIYIIPNILAALLFMVPPLRRTMERSNHRIITLLMWWAQVSISSIWISNWHYQLFNPIIPYMMHLYTVAAQVICRQRHA